MKVTFLSALPFALTLSACATNSYGEGPNAGKRAIYGAGAGAAIGAVAGGTIGAAISPSVVNGRQYYRDTRGYCYYIDRDGQPQYDGTVRC